MVNAGSTRSSPGHAIADKLEPGACAIRDDLFGGKWTGSPGNTQKSALPGRRALGARCGATALDHGVQGRERRNSK
jgi:hypothetical protein